MQAQLIASLVLVKFASRSTANQCILQEGTNQAIHDRWNDLAMQLLRTESRIASLSFISSSSPRSNEEIVDDRRLRLSLATSWEKKEMS